MKRLIIQKNNLNQNNPHKVFKITRSDDVLYLYGESHGGILSFIADKTEFNNDTDRPDLGLCDYVTVPSKDINPEDVKVEIVGSSFLKCGQEEAWSVSFTDKNGTIINQGFEWNIIFKYDIKKTVEDKSIKLEVDNEDLIGSSILLQVIIDGKVMSEKKIKVIVGVRW